MDRDEIMVVWNRFNSSGSINKEIKELKHFCSVSECKYKKLSFDYCKIYHNECGECGIRDIIYILQRKLNYIGIDKEKGEIDSYAKSS